MPGKSWPTRWGRRVLGLLPIGAAAIALGGWLLLAQDSPLAHRIFHALGAKAVEGTDFSIDIHSAGFGPLLNSFRIRGFRAEAGRYATVTFDQLSFRHRLRPLLRSRLSLKSLELDNLTLNVDSTQPFPALTDTPLPLSFDTGHIPSIDLNNVFVLYRLLISTSAPPSDLVLSNVTLTIRQDIKPESSLPFSYRVAGNFWVEHGRPAAFECTGRFDPDITTPEQINLDLDVALKNIFLPDLNELASNTAPFIIQSGQLDYFLNARCRAGVLSGLASFTARDVRLTRNARVATGHFTQMSFEAWEFLARRRDGIIEADCPISGTLLKPVIPLGTVLREQAKSASRNMAARLLEKAPSTTAKKIGQDMEDQAEDRQRYDDILKISRYREPERHFELARHYESVVKNYPQAIEEYRKQIAGYPGETNLAFRSWRAMADIQRLKLKDNRAALASLRQLVDGFPDYRETDDALLLMIDLGIDEKDYPLAAQLCDEFDRQFPHSGLSDQVNRRRKQIASFVW